MRLTASNLVSAINRLPKDQWFEYVNARNKGKVRVVSVTLPEGPVYIMRQGDTKHQSISSKMLWRLANAMQQNAPVNVDRVFAGSYGLPDILYQTQ